MHQYLGAAVLEHVGKTRRLLSDADRDGDRTQSQGGKQDRRKSNIVAEQQRHPVAARHSALREPAGYLRHQPIEAPVGKTRIAADDRLAVEIAGERILEQGMGGPRPVRKALHDASAEMHFGTRRRHDAEPGGTSALHQISFRAAANWAVSHADL